GRGRGPEQLGAEMRDRVRERLDAEARRAAGERGPGGVGRRHDEPAERGLPRRRGDGERAAPAVHAAVEAELAEDAPAGEVGQAEVAEGGEEPEGDRQVEGRARLAHARGPEVDRHPALGVLEAAVAERRPDALGALADGAVGEADGRRVREARRDVDLDVDDDRVDAAEGAGADAGEHESPRAPAARLEAALRAEYQEAAGPCRGGASRPASHTRIAAEARSGGHTALSAAPPGRAASRLRRGSAPRFTSRASPLSQSIGRPSLPDCSVVIFLAYCSQVVRCAVKTQSK